jgi:hypothetical protein
MPPVFCTKNHELNGELGGGLLHDRVCLIVPAWACA